MNWSDERYVRLFTRDTVTWLRWSFETRAVFCLLLRKVDRSGVLETGRGDKAEALALTLMAPTDTCRKALSELTACGTVALGDASLVIPRFIEAQECRMSDAARQKESREKRAVAKLQNHDDACHTPSHDVTAGHTVSHAVTPAVPSRAVPPVPSVPSQDEKKGETPSVPLPLELLPDTPKAKREPKKPDPAAEFLKFRAACTDDERRVLRAYCDAFAVDLGPDWGLQKLVRQRLKAHDADELCAAIRGAGKDQWHRQKGSSLRALLADASTIAQLAKKGAA